MREASRNLVCGFCPRGCLILDGETGVCGAVAHQAGSLVEARPGVAFRLRIGRRASPFRRFLSSAPFLTIESRGSGLKRARSEPIEIWWEGPDARPQLSADEAVFLGRAWGCQGVFLETDDPWFTAGTGEQILNRAHAYSLRTAVCSSGYLCSAARERLLPLVDALELMLWGLSAAVYRKLFEVEREPVLATVSALSNRPVPAVEVTVPLVPGINDTGAELDALSRFVAETLGPKTPIRFLPEDPSLPDERLATACAVARSCGLLDVSAPIREVPS